MTDLLIGLALTALLLRLAARVGERTVVPVRIPRRRS